MEAEDGRFFAGGVVKSYKFLSEREIVMVDALAIFLDPILVSDQFVLGIKAPFSCFEACVADVKIAVVALGATVVEHYVLGAEVTVAGCTGVVRVVVGIRVLPFKR